MTKADLIDIIADRLKMPHGRAELLVGHVFDAMVDALRRDEGIEIRGFGSFSIRTYREYEGRNPRTGEAVHVKPKRLAFFKVGKELRERVNNGRAAPAPGSSGGSTATGSTGPAAAPGPGTSPGGGPASDPAD
jgi:integration host factor subunit beta